MKLAGADTNAGYITANGADNGVAKTPDFIRSLVMRKALDPSTLLALRMNGEPLPTIHGLSPRMIAPGWDGTSWVTWLNYLSVDEKPNAGFFISRTRLTGFPSTPLRQAPRPIPRILK